MDKKKKNVRIKFKKVFDWGEGEDEKEAEGVRWRSLGQAGVF